VHEGGYSVERLSRDRFRFRDPRGKPLPDAPCPPPGSLGWLLERNRPLAIGSETYACGAGDRMDLDLAVSAMLAAVQPRRIE